MAKLVVHGATLSCSMGTAPAALVVAPSDQAFDVGRPIATVLDHLAFANLPPFGMCNAPTNPQVAAASSNAGTHTPQPCVPMVTAPWRPGAAAVDQLARPLLTDASRCQCQWAGSIGVDDPASEIDVE